METLRKAMLRTDGPVEGCITLTVARRAPELTPPGHQRRDSVSSLLTDSSGKHLMTVETALNYFLNILSVTLLMLKYHLLRE